MSVIWKKEEYGTYYEVRSAGKSRRLYTDGVFHSQYNPARDVTGGIWDLLMVPAFFNTPENIKNVLVLGVGGGAVIHQLHRHVEPENITGVELSAMHLYLAKRFFGITDSMVELHEAEAVTWLNNYKGEKFDLIIEDLFGERDGEPYRAVSPDQIWFDLLNKNLNQNGILVMNFTSHKSFKSSAVFNEPETEKMFQSVFQLRMPIYDNIIGVFLKQPSSSSELRENLKAHPRIGKNIRNKNLFYHIKQLR
ncbi:MAG: oxidoreductase [Gammaproteobacteria bacterium]|nr:oxidoreductase [Gammaproteobacteria bacterium]